MVLQLERGGCVNAQIAGPHPRSFWFRRVGGAREPGKFTISCTNLNTPPLNLKALRGAQRTTDPGVPRAQWAERRALPPHAAPLPRVSTCHRQRRGWGWSWSRVGSSRRRQRCDRPGSAPAPKCPGVRGEQERAARPGPRAARC